MIELKKIGIFDLQKYIYIAYEGDCELLEKYHVEKFEIEEHAAMSTLNMIRLTSNDVEMRNYGVYDNGKAIGYLCVFDNFLYSFGINKKQRQMNVLVDFWENILYVLGKSFITMLYPNNTRAINWLKKCGMVEVKEVETNCITLLNV